MEMPFVLFLRDYWVVIAGLGGGFIFLMKSGYVIIQKFNKIDYIEEKINIVEKRVYFIEKDVQELKHDMSFVKGKITTIERMLRTLLSRTEVV